MFFKFLCKTVSLLVMANEHDVHVGDLLHVMTDGDETLLASVTIKRDGDGNFILKGTYFNK